VSAIAAMTVDNVIGKDGKLPWYIPDDLKHFKETTMDKPVIMGRKTYESLKSPLKGRANYVISKQEDYVAENCGVFSSLEEALAYVYQTNPKEIFIIGGGEIYEEAFKLDVLDKLYLTMIYKRFEGDTFFPKIDFKKWMRVIEDSRCGPRDANISYCHHTYIRKRL
jgi:dihydrofolate reductase